AQRHGPVRGRLDRLPAESRRAPRVSKPRPQRPAAARRARTALARADAGCRARGRVGRVPWRPWHRRARARAALRLPAPAARGRRVKLAAIDIGTNSIHLVIVEAASDAFEVIDREKEMVKLGAGLFRARRLSDRAYEEGLDALRRYCKLAEARDVDEVLAVATSACREARNGEQFLEDVLAQTGVRPRVISGLEEARLIHRAVRHALDLRGQRVLVLDIGGGSVEAIVGDEERALARDSMRLGVQRLRDRLGGEPLSNKRLHELRGYVRGVAQDFFETAREHAFTRVVGTSGTIKTLGEAAHLLAGGAPFRTVNAQRVRLKDLTELSKR